MNFITIVSLGLIFFGGIGAILLVIGQSISSQADKTEIISTTQNENKDLKIQLIEIKEERNKLASTLEARDIKLHEKNDTIIELNQKLSEKSEYIKNYVTGGDSWCYFSVRLRSIWTQERTFIKQTLLFVLEHDGVYPLPEVHVKFYKLGPDKALPNVHGLKVIYEDKISWLGIDGLNFNSTQLLDVKLNDSLNIEQYEVQFSTPNGAIQQEIIFKKDALNRWAYATKVERWILENTLADEHNRRIKSARSQTLFQHIDKNFPDKNSLGWKDFGKITSKK